MIENMPNWIDLVFIIIVIVTIFFFHLSNGKPKYVTLLILIWSLLQSGLAYIGFYQVFDTMPPRFACMFIPIVLLFIYALQPTQINWAITNRDLHLSTLLHSVRVPVEIVLFYLFVYKMVPEIMTFEGKNFDILIGLTAPIIALLFIKNRISKKGLLLWNMVGLLFVSFILVVGLLSSEIPIQQFGFEQPNRAVTYFPYVLLPAVVVPLVMYMHLTDIIKLRRSLN